MKQRFPRAVRLHLELMQDFKKKPIMKKLKYFIIATLLFAFGCEDFLEEDATGALIFNEEFFGSDVEAEIVLNGLYDQFGDGDQGYGRDMIFIYEMGVDVLTTPVNRQGGTQNAALQNYTITPSSNGRTGGVFNRCYSIILTVNTLLANIDGNPNISEALIGEALFLRAVAYYHLTHAWGDVFYYRDALPLDQVAQLGQTDRNVIVDDMIEDLIRAGNVMPTESYFGTANEGRANAWAAKTLLMKLHLYRGNWTDAITVGEDIINNSPHGLAATYEEIWNSLGEVGGNANNEVIWQTNYTNEGDQRNFFTDNFVPRIRDEGGGSTDLATALDDANLSFNGFGLAGPTINLTNSFELDDTRAPLMSTGSITLDFGGVPTEFPFNSFYMGKHWGVLDLDDNPRTRRNVDRAIFRIADVHLMLAEAYNENNQPTQASAQIDLIWKRAYEPDRPAYSESDKVAIQQMISDERKKELGGEGHRKFDLVRWGTFVQAVQAEDYGRGLQGPVNVQDFHQLFPFPENLFELLGPGQLEQNPGY